jgi:histidyl-tRNA synthetase
MEIMKTMIQLIRGFKDILPEEIALWQIVEHTATEIFQAFGFKEIRIPVLEKTELFARSIGEDTDIVEKEMYTFADRKGDMLTLRPEATAGVARSYIQHKLYADNLPRKLYTIGPMFRRERPQKGRYRQFYQINAEVFGVASPLMDAQLIFMLMTLLAKLEVPEISAQINSIGCPACRPAYKAALTAFLEDKTPALCEDCRKRKDKNPLRVLDCKVPQCREAISGAPELKDHLCGDCAAHFETVKSSLTRLNVPFVLNSRLVRGLDYYTRTTFEIQTNALGAQNSVAGGGRYDELIHYLGGPQQPAIGFAIGFDRLVAILEENRKSNSPGPDIFVAALGKAGQEKAFEWICKLNENAVAAEMDFEDRSLKAQMKLADRLNARYVMILGEDELSRGVAILRNMATKAQEEIPVHDAVVVLINKIAGKPAD